MRILFLNVLGSVSSDGSRLISALLKRAGHSVKSVYVKKANPDLYPLETEEVEKLHDVLKNAELVLMAVYSGFGPRTVQITNFIRQNYPDLKIIWGGPHCISAPEISLEYADGVCFSIWKTHIPHHDEQGMSPPLYLLQQLSVRSDVGEEFDPLSQCRSFYRGTGTLSKFP